MQKSVKKRRFSSSFLKRSHDLHDFATKKSASVVAVRIRPKNGILSTFPTFASEKAGFDFYIKTGFCQVCLDRRAHRDRIEHTGTAFGHIKREFCAIGAGFFDERFSFFQVIRLRL